MPFLQAAPDQLPQAVESGRLDLVITQGQRFQMTIGLAADSDLNEIVNVVSQVRRPDGRLLLDLARWGVVNPDGTAFLVDVPGSMTWAVDGDGEWDFYASDVRLLWGTVTAELAVSQPVPLGTPTFLPLTIVRGDAFSVRLRLRVADGSPSNITGAAVVAYVRTGVALLVLMPFDVEVEDAPGGVLKLSLTSTQTGALPSYCWWDCQVTWPDELIQTVVSGTLSIIPDVSP